MAAFITQILPTIISICASLGTLLIVYVCKRIRQGYHKRRIKKMIPQSLASNEEVNKEISDSVKELSELELVLAKYGYKLTFEIKIEEIKKDGAKQI